MNSQLMLRIGLKAVNLIQEQIEQGIDANGNKYSYSTKPFARPFDGRIKGLKSLVKQEKISIFRTKKGALWLLVKDGYKAYRQYTGRNPDGDYLTYTGKMLSSLTARATGPLSSLIYFSDAESAQKAFWLTRSGIGKSKKLWNFMGLTNKSEQELLEFIRNESLGTLDLQIGELFKDIQ